MNLNSWLRNQWDRALAIAAAIVGIVCLLLGWIGISGSDLTTQQIPYLASGAVAGLFALGVAATMWLSADLRDEWLKLDEIYQRMEDNAALPAAIAADAEVVDVTEVTSKPVRRRRRVAAKNA